MKEIAFYITGVISMVVIGCQNNAVEEDNNPSNQDVLFVTTEEIIDSIDSKTRTTLDGVHTQWSDDDVIKVFDNAGNWATYKYDSDKGSGKARFLMLAKSSDEFDLSNFVAAYYPGENATSGTSSQVTATIPTTQNWVSGSFGKGAAPMVSNVISTIDGSKEIKFKNAFALLKIQLYCNYLCPPTINTISVKSTSTCLTGNCTFTLGAGNSVTNVSCSSGSQEVTLNNASSAGALATDAKSFYIAVPKMGTSEKVTITVKPVLGKERIISFIANNSGNNTFTTNTLLSMANHFVEPVGALPGAFTINSSGGKVFFAMGNLQWQNEGTHTTAGSGTGAGTWRFADEQYTVLPKSGYGTISSNFSGYTGWIDMFGYGTSGYDSKSPNMTSTTTTDYPYVDISSTNYDWGVYNAISNGGNAPQIWRTLTKEEWNYLIGAGGTYTNSTFTAPASTPCRSGKKYAQAKVNGIYGLIILPDNTISATSAAFGGKTINNLDNADDKYDSNTLTLDDWKKIEQAGCVFLPQNTIRIGTTINDETSKFINYWTSSYAGHKTDKGHCAYYMFTQTKLVQPYGADVSLNYGFPVRVVRDR